VWQGYLLQRGLALLPGQVKPIGLQVQPHFQLGRYQLYDFKSERVRMTMRRDEKEKSYLSTSHPNAIKVHDKKKQATKVMRIAAFISDQTGNITQRMWIRQMDRDLRSLHLKH